MPEICVEGWSVDPSVRMSAANVATVSHGRLPMVAVSGVDENGVGDWLFSEDHAVAIGSGLLSLVLARRTGWRAKVLAWMLEIWEVA